jgi:aspartyl-tRNA(Asn)/glutamyl-tRNA(Gln) amidotransferase subunit A
VSAVELTKEALDAIARGDGEYHSFLWVDAEGALADARAIDDARARGATLGPLAGVPFAVKDNLCTRGVPTTCASRILEGYVPPFDAHVVSRLRSAGAIIVGKTNLDEFAMGSSNENSAFGAVRNPLDPARVPGGSSGGSAAAVAAGFVPAALGSDTGGSVRLPGAFCGLTAVKPTYGRVSRYGLVAFASSFDQVGPLTRTVAESVQVLSVIAGHDPRDATSATLPVPDLAAELGRDLSGVCIGVVPTSPGTSDAMQQALRRAQQDLTALGARCVEVALPHAEHAIAAYYLVANCEASSNLARFDGVRYGRRVHAASLPEMYGRTRASGFGPEVKRRIMLGTYALAAGYYDAHYLRAQRVRTLLRRDYERAFGEHGCDVILSPTAPDVAFRLGERVADPLAMYASDLYTLPPSLAGQPAISVPCGTGEGGLPLGIQLTARPFAEDVLVRVADAYQRATDHHRTVKGARA